MWLRRISSTGAMHLPGFSILITGFAVRPPSPAKVGDGETATTAVRAVIEEAQQFHGCLSWLTYSPRPIWM